MDLLGNLQFLRHQFTGDRGLAKVLDIRLQVGGHRVEIVGELLDLITGLEHDLLIKFTRSQIAGAIAQDLDRPGDAARQGHRRPRRHQQQDGEQHRHQP